MSFICPRTLHKLYHNWSDLPDIFRVPFKVGSSEKIPKNQIENLIRLIGQNRDIPVNLIGTLSKVTRDLLCEDDVNTILTSIKQQKHVKNYFESKCFDNGFYIMCFDGEILIEKSFACRNIDITDLNTYMSCREPNIILKLEPVRPLFDLSIFEDISDSIVFAPANKSSDDDYLCMKATIDSVVFKITDPLCYCKIRDDGSLQLCTFNQLKEIYSTYVLYDGTREYNFFDKWSKDPTKVEYSKIDFLPYPCICPSDVYNLWHKLPCDGELGDIRYFTEIMNLIDGGSTYMINYLAHLVQKPGEMPLTGIVLRGVEGSGKNTVTTLCKKLIGDDQFFYSSDPSRDVFCRFSEAVRGKLVINFDEAESKKMFACNEDIKSLITNPTCNYEKKNIQPITIRSFVRVIATTNNTTPLKITISDRRWVVFNMLETYVKNKTYWGLVYKWLDDPENIKYIYNHLMKHDLSHVNLTDIPITDPLNEIKQSCLPLEIKWVCNLIIDNFPTSWVGQNIDNIQLYYSYKEFIPSKFDSDIRGFGIIMKKLNIDGFIRGRNKYGITWLIDRQRILDWLILKKYTDENIVQDTIEVLHLV